MSGDPQLRAKRLARCVECERPFPQPVSEERARAEWGDAADDEIAYACEWCAEAHGLTISEPGCCTSS